MIRKIQKLGKQIDKAFSFEESGLIAFIVIFIISDLIIRNKYTYLVYDDNIYNQKKHLGYLLLFSSCGGLLASLIDIKYE